MNTLGTRIAFLRKKQGLSQRKLMELLEFNNLSKYEKNQRQPNYEILQRIADFFNVSTDWLLTGNETINKANQYDNTPASILGELTNEDIRFLQLFRQLNERDKIKIEGIMEAKITEM